MIFSFMSRFSVLNRLSILPILLFSLAINSQQIQVTGKVTDSLQNPLGYANILAMPEADDQEVRFAITKEDGSYQLGLAKNQTYELTVSFLGYISQKLILTTGTDNLLKNFTLKESTDQLTEITLNYTPPITVKKDTLTYRLDAFTTGEERKLRDALKKLPGIEVDKAGNVTSQGRRITKVLVENKTFFTGDSKLAVNNIPADAVNEVEILDNYNDVPMLKGLQDNEDLAMNIKLKEDKKKFAFGDVEVGAGYKERYVIHPNLFYYSPKININFIGDLNNTGIKSFTFRDYLEFEGGFGKLLSDASGYFSLYNSDFSQYLNDSNFNANTNQFGALNIRQSINNATDISGYVITSNSKTQTQQETLNNYLNFGNPFTEERSNSNLANSFFTLGKLTVNYKPDFSEDLEYNTFIKATNNDATGVINTINPTQSNTIATNTDVRGIDLKQNLNYSRKFSKAHTATLEATYNFKNDEPLSNWLTNQRILQGLIPLEDDEVFNIMQRKRVNSHSFNAIVKDYWVLNNFNHIYTSAGVNTAFSNFFTEDVQELSNGDINNFNTAGFGNDFKYSFVNTYIGMEYKFQIGKTIFKPGLFYNSYVWRTQQEDEINNQQKNLWLPQLNIKVEFNNSQKLNFDYRLNARFASVDRLANNFVLTNFNSVFKGDETLENTLYHTARLSYYKFSLFRNLNYNINASFNKRLKNFKAVTELDGIDQFRTQILLDLPEHNFNISGRISKKINKIRYNLSGNYNYSDFYQIVNQLTSQNTSNSISGTSSVETLFKNFPNLEIGYTKDFNNYKSFGNDNQFENDRFFVNLEYDFLKHFIFKADYSYDNYNNKTNNISNTFDTANASLFYQVEDSPWGFEINATNLFDIKFRQNNSFSDFLISDNRTFVMPRIIMFKIAYKL